MGVGHAQYNMINYGKNENVLLDKCLLYLYLNPEYVGQYLGTYHNNVAQIFSETAHDVKRYRETLFAIAMLAPVFFKYGNQEVLHNF